MFPRRFCRLGSLLMALLLCLSATVPALAEGGCAHANAYRTSGPDVDYVFEETNPGQHKVITVTYEYTYCPDCGHVSSGSPLNETTTTTYESHSFTNGVCALCKWTCTHKFNTSGYCEYCRQACNHQYTYIPDEGTGWHTGFCSVCGKRTSGPHTYVDGVCTICDFDNHFPDGCINDYENNHIVSCGNPTVCLKTGATITTSEYYRSDTHHGPTLDETYSVEYAQKIGDSSWDKESHWTYCVMCGDRTQDDHVFENGKCTLCGATGCSDGCDGVHTVLCENPTVCAVSGKPIPSGEPVEIHHGHTLDDEAEWEQSRVVASLSMHYYFYSCPLCGLEKKEDWGGHNVTCTNLTCSDCGYTVDEEYDRIQHSDSDYVSNETKHWRVCPDCGLKYDEGYHYRFGDDTCYECSASFTPVECQHYIICGENVCQRCGKTVSPDADGVEIEHVYSNKYIPLETGYHGMLCESCGIVMEKCFHVLSYAPGDYGGDCDYVVSHIDADGHGFLCVCGVFWYEPHVMVNGKCLGCGYTGESKHVLSLMSGSFDADESGHWRTCAHCNEKVTQEHTMKNDKCITCGYVKGSITPTPIPTPIPTATPTPVPTATPTAEPTAVPTAEPTAVPTAEPTAVPTAVPTAEPTVVPTAVPTAEPTAVPTAEPTAEPTAKPTAKPTSTPVVTPTPVPMPTVEPLDPIIDYEDVEETEVVHGVVATEPQRIVTTLVTAIEQIGLENVGKETSIEIRNVEKVITETEKVVFDTLPAKEQVLVLLSSIGYETEVASALSSMDMTLSEDAVALTASIQERLANASEEEKAAFEQMLTDSFPVETITIDGVEYEYFVIELIVDIDGDVHVERYGFRFDENGEWIFSKLSIGTIVE